MNQTPNQILSEKDFGQLGPLTQQGITATSGGRNQFSDAQGNTYYQNETGVGTPQYARSFEKVANPSIATGENTVKTPGTTPAVPTTGTGINRTIYGDQPAAVAPKTVDEIQQEKLKESQGAIDNLNNYYNTLSDNQKVTNDKNTRSTNAVSVLTGLGASSEASVAAKTTTAGNDKALAAVEQQRTAAINEILTKISSSAEAEAEQNRQDVRQSEQDRLTYRQNTQKEAVDNLTALTKATPGLTLAGLKATLPLDQYQHLIENAGGESLANAIIFENRPKDSILGTPQLIGGKMVQAYQTSSGVKYESVDLPAGVTPDNIKSIEKTDNGLFIIHNDGTYTRIADSAKPGSGATDLISINSQSGKPMTVPVSVAPYVNTSSSGVTYADLSSIQGTAAEKKQIVDDAQKAGLKIILNKNTAADLVNIQDANSKLDTIGTIMSGIGQPSALARDLGGMGLTNLAAFAQTDPQKAAAGALQSVGLDILKAMSGVQGFRGNSSVVQQINDHMPKVTDTVDVASQKIDYIRRLISDREDGIVGKPDTGPANTPKGSMSNNDFVEKALSSQKLKYGDVTSSTPTGQIPVLLNSSGQVGYIPESEFDGSLYTRI